MTKVLLCSNPENLRAALGAFTSTGTVEAEYGDVVVTGTKATLAHHGPRAAAPCPCFEQNWEAPDFEAIGLSHVDIDAIGGTLALLGRKPHMPRFWEVAAYVDLHGPHRLGDVSGEGRAKRQLYAFWAWSKEHRCFPPRDGSVLDVTEYVEAAWVALDAIRQSDEYLLAAGDEFRAAEDALNAASFKGLEGYVIRRESAEFTNHLYVTPAGRISAAVVAVNEAQGSVTVSLADPVSGVSCRDVVQGLWGPTAGGHAGIAGSPREWTKNFYELRAEAARASAALNVALARALPPRGEFGP